MPTKDTEMFYPKTKKQWRNWLLKNHKVKENVWLIMYKKHSGYATIGWSDAVDEALCFGWIDSVKNKLDDERSIQFFSKRKPKSTWSKINKLKVENLIATGKMTQAGLECIEITKKNGAWELLDSVEELMVPPDLELALLANDKAMDYFQSLNKSTKKAMLQWLVMAKKPETRNNRIKEIAILASQKQKPKQF